MQYIIYLFAALAIIISVIVLMRSTSKPVFTWDCPRCRNKEKPHTVSAPTRGELDRARAFHEHLRHDDPWPSHIQWIDPRRDNV